MASVLLNSGQTRTNFYVSDFSKEQTSNRFDAFEMVRELTDIMFPESISEDRLSYWRACIEHSKELAEDFRERVSASDPLADVSVIS